jgi:hypothetical protein
MKITIKPANFMGMNLEEHKSSECTAVFAVSKKWVSLYEINSKHKNQGHAQALIKNAIDHYKGKKMCGSFPLCPAMKHIYDKLKIEYHDDN